jgi:hypothetical protein
MTLSAEKWKPPDGAVRNGELEAWEVSERDAAGERNGDATLYRDDGSILLRCHYESGKRSGAFTSYHSGGEIESEGTYVDGALDGAFFRHRSDRPDGAPLRSCCVPPGARKLRVIYRRGMPFSETFYDGTGRALRSDGTLVPERAPGLPDEAAFEEADERWVERVGADDGTMLRRSFDLSGRLLEETEIVRGKRVALREFEASLGLVRELHFDESGATHGACTFRYGESAAPYADRRVREVRGAFEHGQSVGLWQYLDENGRELASQERGEALSDERLLGLFEVEDKPPGAESLSERGAVLLGAGRVREALFFAARAAARTGRVERLLELLATAVVPLQSGAASARVATLDRDESPSIRGAFDALLDGGNPAEVLRLLATLIPASLAHGRDMADAALLLEPGSPRALVTRALIQIEQGDREGALRDLDALGDELAPAAGQVRELARVLFPTFRFNPALEPPPEPAEELAQVGVGQPLDAVRRTIALYATRLGAIRAELRARLGAETEWLPPDLGHLLEGGPIEARRFSATITDEDENGSESSEVTVDETLELAHVSAATLMVAARAEWDALSWLCWSAGLDEVALPETLTPRPSFAAAVNESMQRYFRTRDQLSTAGLVSRSRGIPGFVWEGLPVDALDGRLAEIAERQYFERRALFFYLLFPQNISPFQSDLRQAQ